MQQLDKKNETSSRNPVINISVAFLDERVESFKVPGRCLGQQLYDLVLGKLGSFEYRYFDLAFLDVEGNHCWLDHKKPLLKALRSSGHSSSLEFAFGVKYYVPHPNLIEDPHTRYLFALQLKRDFFHGLLHSNRNTSLLLAAFIVQSELGDYMETECKSYAYLKKHHLLRSAPDSYLMRVMELHQTLVGLTKEEADYRLLDAARKVELYGVRLHPVKDTADQPFNLAVTHAGVLVFQRFSRVNTYIWSKIRKLSFNRHKFLVKLHNTGDQDYLNDTVEYMFPTRNGCKNFWRKCIEQHAFFRSVSSLFPSNGSGRPGGLLESFRSGSLSSVRRLRRSASCGATGPMDSLNSSMTRTSEGPTSSGQASQLSTPVRKLARIRQHAASFRFFGRQHKRNLDELQSPCLLSDSKPAWALPEHPYKLPNSCVTGAKPIGVSKLQLSNCPNPTAEHFQLLRLSFTSLIPETGTANRSGCVDSAGQTTPTCTRMRTLERLRERAVSTPSIHQQVEMPRRKRSCHAFVPRQFNPLGSATLPGRLQSQASDGGLDRSASRTFPKRPDLDEGQSVSHRDTGDVLLSPVKVYRLNGYLHRTPSSSCSLASDMSPTPLSENETTLNDMCRVLSPPLDRRDSSTDAPGDNDDHWSVSPQAPSSTVPALPRSLSGLCSPRLILRSNTDEAAARLRSFPSLDHIRNLSPASLVPDSDLMASNLTSAEDVDHATAIRKSSGAHPIVTDEERPGSDRSEQLSPGQPSVQSDRVEQIEPDEAAVPAAVVTVDSAMGDDTLMRLGDSPIPAATSVSPELDANFSTEPELNKPRERVCESRSEVEGVYFSDSESRGVLLRSGEHGEEIPESLADAVSLGAISMMTGISCYDDLPDEDEEDAAADEDGESENADVKRVGTGSEVFRPANRNPIAGCTSLKQLGRSYWGPSSSSSSSVSPAGPIGSSPSTAADNRPDTEQRIKLVRSVQRTKSEPFCVSAQRFAATKRRPKRVKRKSPPTKVKPCSNQFPSPDARAQHQTVIDTQRKTEMEFNLHFLQQAVQAEEVYQRDLHFLARHPLELARAGPISGLIEWLEQRMLPVLQPLVQRHDILLNCLKSELRRLESTGIRSTTASSDPICPKLSKDDRAPSGDILAEIFDANLARTEQQCDVESDQSLERYAASRTRLASSGSSNTTYSVLQPGCDSRTQSSLGWDRVCQRSIQPEPNDATDGCFSKTVFPCYLDLLEPYTSWITENANLIVEFWHLAYSDLLAMPTSNSDIPHPVLDTDCAEDTRSSRWSPPPVPSASLSSQPVSRARSVPSIDTDSRGAASGAQPSNDSFTRADPSLVRHLWHCVESRQDCTMPLPIYLLRPGRHCRQYCVLFGSLLAKYTSSSHPDLPACKAVFTEFVQLARSIYPVYRHAEQIALMLQSARWVLPVFGFLGLLPSTPSWTCATAGGETELPVFVRSGLMDDVSSPAVWPRSVPVQVFREHMTSMPRLCRVGWLKKYSRRGFQPRMVFLFEDRIVFASRIRGTPYLFLKIHGIISLDCAYVVKEQMNLPNDANDVNDSLADGDPASFAVVVVVLDAQSNGTQATATAADGEEHSPSRGLCDSRSSRSRSAATRTSRRSRSRSKSCARRKFRRKLLFCAPDEVTRDLWVADIARQIERSLEAVTSAPADTDAMDIDRGGRTKLSAGVFRFRDPDLSEWVRDELIRHQQPMRRQSGHNPVARGSLSTRPTSVTQAPSLTEVPGCLTDSLLTVCWHRHISMSDTQLLNANDCEMSGYLLRKFKHGTGWQKLWAVLSDLSLLFYKSPDEAGVLARLGLLGYTVRLLDVAPTATTKRPGPGKPAAAAAGPQQTMHVLQLSHGSKQYQLRAETPELLMSWFHVFSAILTGTQSASKSSTDAAAQLTTLPAHLPGSLSSRRCGSAELVYKCQSPTSSQRQDFDPGLDYRLNSQP